LIDMDKKVKAANKEIEMANSHNQFIGGPELRALVINLVIYLVRGAIGVPGYGKTIAGSFLARTDFATIFKQLPKPLYDYLTSYEDIFIHIVISAAADAVSTKKQYKGN